MGTIPSVKAVSKGGAEPFLHSLLFSPWHLPLGYFSPSLTNFQFQSPTREESDWGKGTSEDKQQVNERFNLSFSPLLFCWKSPHYLLYIFLVHILLKSRSFALRKHVCVC